MKRVVPLALLLFCIGHTPRAEVLLVPTTTAEVMAWNLAGFNAIPRERAATFARVVAELDPEILALVEVNPDFMAAEIVAEMNERGVCYQRKILGQTARQNIAVLHKCAAAVTNPRFIPGSDDGDQDLRQALAADVRIGEFDFLLIAVHLKSGRSSSDRATRDRQCAAIREFVESSTGGAERDVLIVGDYNMIPGQDQSNFTAMNPGNFLRFLTSEELPPGTFSHVSSSGTPGNLLDGFAISRSQTEEYLVASIQVFPLHQELGLALGSLATDVSDHFPVIARFRITEDDD